MRDFAYPVAHPCHYGPPFQASEAVSTASTPASEAQSRFSDVPPRPIDSEEHHETQPLPPLAFGDGPPYSEDEDLHSPIVLTSRQRKHRIGNSGEWDDVSPISGPPPFSTTRVDSPLGEDRLQSPLGPGDSGDLEVEVLDVPDEDESCYSKDYQFTIASADEEMHGKAVALFDFARENENELPLVEGQVIWVSYRHGQGWLVAQDPRTGDAGLVPEEYVRLLREIEGGLGSLHSPDAVEEENVEEPEDPTSPVTNPMEIGHSAKRSSGSNSAEKSHAVLSSFSTSSNDLNPYPHPIAGKQAGQPPPLVTHYSGQTNSRSPISASDSPRRFFENISPLLEKGES